MFSLPVLNILMLLLLIFSTIIFLHPATQLSAPNSINNRGRNFQKSTTSHSLISSYINDKSSLGLQFTSLTYCRNMSATTTHQHLAYEALNNSPTISPSHNLRKQSFSNKTTYKAVTISPSQNGTPFPHLGYFNLTNPKEYYSMMFSPTNHHSINRHPTKPQKLNNSPNNTLYIFSDPPFLLSPILTLINNELLQLPPSLNINSKQ